RRRGHPRRSTLFPYTTLFRSAVGGIMALSRRHFVQTVGIGAGAALTNSVWGRGRENSVWSAFEPELQAVERGVICIASNENPVRSEEHTSELQSRSDLVCRLL